MKRRDLLKAVALSAAAGPALWRTLAPVSGETPVAEATPVGNVASLLLVRWELEAILRADGSTLIPETPADHTIQLVADGRIWVQADCNSGSGSYTLDGTFLTVSDLVTTLIGCQPGSIGSDFTAALATVSEYRISTDASDKLTLSMTDGATMTFNPGVTGVIWEFFRFQGGDGSEVVVDDPSRYTLEFPGDGTVRVQADCNQGMGKAKIDGDAIDLSVTLTRMACLPGSHATDFARYLDEAVSWVIRDGQLHLALPVDAGIASFTPVVASSTPTATPKTG